MKKLLGNIKSPIPTQIKEFFAKESKEKNEKEQNRRNLMRKQMLEIVGDKNIIISNSSLLNK